MYATRPTQARRVWIGKEEKFQELQAAIELRSHGSHSPFVLTVEKKKIELSYHKDVVFGRLPSVDMDQFVNRLDEVASMHKQRVMIDVNVVRKSEAGQTTTS